MQLNQFRFLIAVDKYGSISRAARTDAVLITPRMEVVRSNRDYRYKLVPLTVEDFDVDVFGGWVHDGTCELNRAESCVVEALEAVCEDYLLLEA